MTTNSFEFTAEQEAFRAVVREYGRSKLASSYLSRAKSEEYPWEQQAQLGDLGIFSMLLPPEFGGPPEPEFMALGIACEELGWADFNVANLIIPAALMGSLIARFATDSVRERWLPGLAEGREVIALGLTEPDVGSDAGRLRVTARKTADGWVLNGEKTSTTAATSAHAAVVFARTDPDPTLGPRGVSAFMVPLDLPGISKTKFLDTGFIPLGRGGLSLDDVVIPHDHLLGEEGKGFSAIMNGFDFSRPLLGLACIGTAQAAIDETVEYAKERRAFGRPISQWEGVSFPLAEHATYLEAARWLCYRTLALREQNKRHTAEASMCKWWAPKMAVAAIHDCLLLHGHVAYSQEHPMEQRMRDVMGIEIGDGTAQIQKIVIARELFGSEFRPY